MLNVFLSGGMSGLSRMEMVVWRRVFAVVAKDYYPDIKVISPVEYSTPNGNDDNEKEAFIFDLHWIRRCDLVVVNMNNPKSIGTAQELALAYELKKPIIVIATKEQWDKTHPWIKLEATKVFFRDDYEREHDIYIDVCNCCEQYG